MYGFKKFKFLYMVLAVILLFGAFNTLVEAYEYKIGASRKHVSGSDAYIVGTGTKSITYSRDYFTGLGYCTGYYYVSYETDIPVGGNDSDITLGRQVFEYDSSNISLIGDYVNLKLTPGQSTPWITNNLYGPFSYDGKSLFRFNVFTPGGSPNLLTTYTLGRMKIINTSSISDTSVSLYARSVTSNDESTHITHTNSTLTNDLDRDYSFDIKYYAQPCVPDMPISDSNIALLYGDVDGGHKLARVPAFDGVVSESLNAGKPITAGASNNAGLADTNYFLPGRRNISTFQNDITFDDGIFIRGIKEPEKNSQGPLAFDQDYYYASGGPSGRSFNLLDSDFVYDSSDDITNQWGIDPSTIKITVSFTGVDANIHNDDGAFCSFVASGIDLNLNTVGYPTAWNGNNKLGYSVNISSGTLRNLAKTKCSTEFSSVLEQNIDIKRETQASISWDAYDFSNSMIISQDSNDVTYADTNRITGTTGYNFNSWTDDPVLSMNTKDGTSLTSGGTNYNIPLNGVDVYFEAEDGYAGIDLATLSIVVTGYESSIKRSNNWGGGTGYSNTFVNPDINASSIATSYGRYDYTGYVDVINDLASKTGMHFDVYFEAEDNVGNKTTREYSFRTPTWPNAPHGTPSLISAQTNSQIDQINIIDDIAEDNQAIGDPSNEYNYGSYYPSSSGLIDKFEYISGSNYISQTTDLVLTENNGNIGGTIVTLTGLKFVYNGASSYITGTPHVSNAGLPMNDYLATNFEIEILATNIYGITGVLTYTINVAPSCTESPGCTDPVYVFWGTDLDDAKLQRSDAYASGTEYLKANHRYPHWFAEIKQTGPNFYFDDVAGQSGAKVLYCASTGTEMLIDYDGYMGPVGNDQFSISSDTFTGSSLSITGSEVELFGNSNITTNVTANYETIPENGTDKMTIYVNRPLTGRMFYSICEFTGSTLDDFGCPVPGNYTSDVNWTKLDPNDEFVITGWIEGGWLTGDWDGYVTGGSLVNGNTVDHWGDADVYNGGGTRVYSKTLTGGALNINSSGEVLFDIENRKGLTSTVPYEIYWIDNFPVEVTGYISSFVGNQSATLTLSGYNTGVLATSTVSTLTGDDQFIVTKFSGDVAPSIFQTGYNGIVHTGSWYINGSGSEYKMIHEMVFAEDWEGEICFADRAGNESCTYVEVTGIGLRKDMVITVKPAFRPEPAVSTTGYSIVDGDFWLWVKSGSVWTHNYNSSKGNDPKVTTNLHGTGIVSVMTPSSGAEYLVVFKGSGTLSAGFTGIWSDDIAEFNFFSGTYANTLSGGFVYKYNNGGTIEHYLKVGDVSVNGSGDYDAVISADFSMINNNLTVGSFNSPIRHDFDLNYVISSMEQSMVLQAYNDHGFIGWLNSLQITDPNYISMTGFVDL